MRIAILSACWLAAVTLAAGNTYVYRPIERLPSVEDVIAFSNGKPPATGERRIIPRDDVMRFLSHGSAVRERSKWVRTTRSLSDVADGVFFDRSGRAYFWSLSAPGVLVLETENGESIQIILNEK